ncbi:MAG: nitroreductase family protein [Spirochaetes bacterium]|nr:nitroreductase family protein [Spirochaetota bacterium]
MELKEAIYTRRSIRKFTEEMVTDDEIKEMLDAARFAPSWANVQPWEFIVVRDKSIIERITNTYSPNNPARKCSLACSALIVVCGKQHLSGYKDGAPVTRFDSWYMFDLGMAVQNLCLRAHDMGLGTVVVGFMNHDECRRILEVPAGYEVVAAIPVGKPAVVGKEGPPRRPLSEIVHLNKFGVQMK